MYPNEYEMNGQNAETNGYRSSGNHVNTFDQAVVYTNSRQSYDCNEQNVRQFLNDFCVNTIKLIIQEMQFYLNMLTYKKTKKHLFTKQNRGELKMQGIIDISYRQITTFTLQIIVHTMKLGSRERDMVLQWLYDECDKLCDQFHSEPLNRADLFFEHLFQHCEEELKDREATQSHLKRMKKSNLPNAYQMNQQQMCSYEFAVPPPPYTSPNNPMGKFSQNPYQPYRPQQQLPSPNFVRPNGLRQYSVVQTVAQPSPFDARSQRMNAVTQAPYMQRPMTAPIHTTTSETLPNMNRNSHSQYTVANSNATRNQWPAQSINHFQQLNPSQNVDTSQLKTMLQSPQQPMHTPYSQQGTASNRVYEIVDSNNGNQSTIGTVAYGMNGQQSFQQVLFAPTLHDQQATLNATGFEALPIQRQRTEDLGAASNNARDPREHASTTYCNETSTANSLSQSYQPQQQISMIYDECLADGTRTPTFRLRLEMNDLLDFNASDPTSNGNIQMQAITNQRSNELFTPNNQTNNYQSGRIDEIVNDELRLSDSVESLEFEFGTTSNVSEVLSTVPMGNQVSIENLNSKRADAEVSQPIVNGVTEPLPSMPELSVDPNAEKSALHEPNPPIMASESPNEPPTSKSAGISTASCAPNSATHNSDAPCTSKSILNPRSEPAVTTSDRTIVGTGSSSETEDNNDCEMVLVETHTQFKPFMKKEEPNEPNDDPESGNYCSFDDIPSTRRKCKRYIDLTEEEDDCDSDVVVLESDEEGVIEQKFVSISMHNSIAHWRIIEIRFCYFRFP